MSWLIYYDSKTHGVKFSQQTKRRWLCGATENGVPKFSYKKKEASWIKDDGVDSAIGTMFIFFGYTRLKKVRVQV